MSFIDDMKRAAEKKQSRIVLALDFPFEKPENRKELFAKADSVLDSVCPHLCAVKFNHHLVLPLGLFDGVQELVRKVHQSGLMAIMDCKVNDIGATNRVIAEYYYRAGFDALIANPFIGWEEGLEPIFEVAHQLGRGVILLVYMSHKGAPEGYGQSVLEPQTGKETLQYVSFAKRALALKADGIVVGATYPDKIREILSVVGDKVPIYSPGIGAQGGEIASAIRSGTSYLIVGRSITQSEDPASAAKQVRDLAKD